MPQKFPVNRADELLKRSAEANIDPHALIAITPIRKEQTIVDVGSGPGYLTIPLAKYLYDGKVYAIDVQSGMLDRLADLAETERVVNIELIKSKENSIPLEDNISDGAVLAHVLAEASKPLLLLKETARLLKPGSWLAVVEREPRSPQDTTMSDMSDGAPFVSHTLPRERVLDIVKEAGFKMMTIRSVAHECYAAIFQKPRPKS